MSQYEICFITLEEKDNAIVKKKLEAFGAKILFEQKIGRKKFVYPIKKERAGFYQSIYFNFDNKKIADLSQKLQSESSLLRFLIIKNEMDIKKLIGQEKAKLAQTKKIPQAIKTEKTEEPKNEIPEKEIVNTQKQEIKNGMEPVIKEEIKKGESEREEKNEKIEYDKKKEEIKKEKDVVSELEEERIKKLEEKLDELLKE